MWKTLTVLTILLAGAGATFRYLNTDAAKLETKLRERSEANLVAVEEQMDEMDSQITSNADSATKTNGEAEAEGAKLETARTQLAEMESEKTSIEGQIAEKTATLDALKEQLADLGDIEELSEKVDGLQLEMATVKQDLLIATEKFKGLVAAKAGSETQIATFKEKEEMVQSGKMTSLNARVSQNFGDWGFVVINAGATQGVNSRAMLDVKSGDDIIAKLQVTNLESNVAVCDVLSVVDGATISTGNRVTVAEESRWDPAKAAAAAAAAAAPAPAADGGAEPAPAPAPAGGDAGDPFGLDGGAGTNPAPAAGGDDPFGLGGDAEAPSADAPADDADPFGLN